MSAAEYAQVLERYLSDTDEQLADLFARCVGFSRGDRDVPKGRTTG